MKARYGFIVAAGIVALAPSHPASAAMVGLGGLHVAGATPVVEGCGRDWYRDRQGQCRQIPPADPSYSFHFGPATGWSDSPPDDTSRPYYRDGNEPEFQYDD